MRGGDEGKRESGMSKGLNLLFMSSLLKGEKKVNCKCVFANSVRLGMRLRGRKEKK